MDSNEQAQFEIRSNIAADQTAVTVTGKIPRDVKAGDYHTGKAYVEPCPDYQSDIFFTVPSNALSVKAFPSPVKPPGTSKLELSLTQKQFLDTKIAQLDDLNSQLTTTLEGHAADLPPLREYLAGVVQSAEDDLSVTKEQYREQIIKPKENLPAFFADFFAQYQELLIELKAPTPGVPLSDSKPDVQLVYVQLKKRTPTEQLSSTWPSIAKTVWGTIKDNIAAYVFVRDNGTDKFTVAITSYPKGASIQVKKLIDDDYTDYGQTNISSASFELATWIFKFHHPECSDERLLRIDPYEDTQPVISAEFLHCKGR